MKRAKPDAGLRAIFHQHLPHMHWTAIETAMTGAGVPDSNCCWKSCEFWVEYKWTHGWTVGLRPEQVGWLLRRHRAGGRAFVAVRRKCIEGPRKEAVDELWLFPAACAAVLKDAGLRGAKPLLVEAGGPARWDWDAIGAALIRP